jgi:hypothetical protein
MSQNRTAKRRLNGNDSSGAWFATAAGFCAISHAYMASLSARESWRYDV